MWRTVVAVWLVGVGVQAAREWWDGGRGDAYLEGYSAGVRAAIRSADGAA